MVAVLGLYEALSYYIHTALRNYSQIEPPAYTLQSKNSVLHMVAGTGIQWNS
jgi:hypothetical protein